MIRPHLLVAVDLGWFSFYIGRSFYDILNQTFYPAFMDFCVGKYAIGLHFGERRAWH